MPEGRTIVFRTARVVRAPGFLFSVFPDGSCCVLDIEAGDNPHYRSIAAWAGYDDWRRYALEHDLTHHAVADVLGRPSPALWRAARMWDATQETDDEEVLVNALQRRSKGCTLAGHELAAIAAFQITRAIDRI